MSDIVNMDTDPFGSPVTGEILPREKPLRASSLTSPVNAIPSDPYSKIKGSGAATGGRLLNQLLVDEGLKLNQSTRGDASAKSRFQRVVEKIYDRAESGDMVAVGIIFDRVLGKAPANVTIDNASDIIVLAVRGASTSEL